MPTLAFVDRPPTAAELERIRLLLSTYQDGTGMLAAGKDRTLPGWRDFERSVALGLSGQASESKEIFDVLLRRESDPQLVRYGLSCKMRRELNRVDRDGRVTIEVSNSAGKFWDDLAARGLGPHNYRAHAEAVGPALIELVRSWHRNASVGAGGRVDLGHSYYLVLLWNAAGVYQLFQYPLDIIDPSTLNWSFPMSIKKGEQGVSRRLCGIDSTGTVVEWYGESGGQLKFFPLAAKAIWASERFLLEPLPDAVHGVLQKAGAYFGENWLAAQETA